MKKIISVLLACAMVFSLSLTVFAADSPSADLGLHVDYVTSDDEDTTVDYVTSDDEDEYAATESLLDGSYTPPGIDGYILIAVVDIESSASSVTLNIASSVATITADSDIIVLHYTGGSWTQESATPGDGTVTITASSFSPFAIYLKIESTEETTTTTASSDDESPQTSDTNVMLYVAIVALIAAAGATLAARKIRG